MRPAAFLAVALTAALPIFTAAQAASVSVEHAWARASAGPVKTGAAFLTVTNADTEADRLVGASTPVATTVEIHTHIKDGDVMRMRRVDGIDVPAGGSATLAPGGLHLMLMGLKAPLEEGTSFPLTLDFEKAGTMEVTVDVLGAGAMGAGGHKH